MLDSWKEIVPISADHSDKEQDVEDSGDSDESHEKD